MDPPAWGLSITDIDPCIFFGGGFNYTLCRQHSAVRIATLGGGSIILFGSVGGPQGWQQEKTGQFYLDTCFVVGDSAEVSTGECDRMETDGSRFSNVTISTAEWDEYVGEGRMRESLKDRDVPEATRAAWRKLFMAGKSESSASVGSHPGATELPSGRWPTSGSNGPEVRRVYKGVGFPERAKHGGMFSFVPAWRGDELRQRPTLDLDALSDLGMPRPADTGKSGGKWAAAVNGQLLGACEPRLDSAQPRQIWEEIVAQVRRQRFELGCWFAPPPPMPPAMAVALEKRIPLSEKASIEMAESDLGKLKKGVRVVDRLWKADPLAVWTVERVLSGPALRLDRKGGRTRDLSLVDRAQREALQPAQ
jgi:hypothetical protein